MIDPVQITLLIVIVILTILLVVLGVQIFLILREFRKTVKKTNKILDNAYAITSEIEGPVSALSSMVLGVKAGSIMTVLKVVKSFLGRDKELDDKRD